MEKSTVLGLGSGLILIYATIFMGSGWQTFFDVASLILVLGGTAAGLMVGFSFKAIKQSLAATKAFFSYQEPVLSEKVTVLTELARIARRDGLLALDRRLGELEDPFICSGLELAVDGVDGRSIATILDQQIAERVAPQQLGSSFYNAAGSYCPAFGMIGTLIGLIQMLQNLTDPAQIGAGMSVALITTFYGALFANLIFLPFANKMKAQMATTYKMLDLSRTGILAIVDGEAPQMIEKRLSLYLSGEEAEETVPAPEAELAMAA